MIDVSDTAATDNGKPLDAPACHEGLRERKKRESREAMHLAALELVAEHGFAQVTVDQIAERAGVSPRTLFNYWGTKEAVVLGVDTENVRTFVDMLEERPAGEAARDSMRVLIEAHVKDASMRSESRNLKKHVMMREPQLIQIVANRNKEVSMQIRDVLAQRLSPTLGAERARDAAAIHVSRAVATLRSVYAIAVNRNVDLAEALPIFYDLDESGCLDL